MILGLGTTELIVILLVVLVIFGPKNLPKLGNALGKTVKNVREGMEGDEDEDEKSESKKDDAVDVVEDEDDADAPADGQFCPKCGAHNEDDAAFCCKCGHKLASDDE